MEHTISPARIAEGGRAQTAVNHREGAVRRIAPFAADFGRASLARVAAPGHGMRRLQMR